MPAAKWIEHSPAVTLLIGTCVPLKFAPEGLLMVI
jgi:hypothetical protein